MKKISFLTIVLVAFFLGICGVKAESRTIVVKSVDKETGETVKGSGFSITRPDSSGGGGTSSAGEYRETTNMIGTHYLRETHASPGYLPLEQSVININITASTASTVTVTTKHIPIKVKVEAIPNYTYQIKNASGKVIDTWVQAQNVLHSISKVPVGKYTIEVKKAPSGYEIPNGIWTVNVPANQEINSVTVRFTPTLVPPIPSPTPTPTPKPTIKPTAKPTPTPKPTIKPTVKPTTKPSQKPDDSKEEILTNVPNTKVSQSMIFYVLGTIVVFSGVGMIYKRTRQN